MQLTPIFDQLVEEFVQKDIHILGLYETTPPAITVESVREGISFLANLGEVLAQDEEDDDPTVVVEARTDEEGEPTAEFDMVAELIEANMQTADEMREGNGVTDNTLYDASHLATIKPAIPEMVKMPRQSVSEALKEADEELGIAEFDEAFEEADRKLEPHTSIVTLPAKASPATVAAFKRNIEQSGWNPKVEQAVPRRQNKRNNRNKNRNRVGGNANKVVG